MNQSQPLRWATEHVIFKNNRSKVIHIRNSAFFWRGRYLKRKEVTSLKVFDINWFDPVYCGITKWKNFKNWFGNVITSFPFEFAVSNHRRDKLTATMVKKINLKYALHTLNVISMVSWLIHWIILKIPYFHRHFN